ncbi:MAG: riboflavin synthase [Planctomycetes bacterium]|nr:riboflavin synthase [Planctomycetota bacterium]MCH8118618.1 riboflavin synthase [Planctomycetota bacterium]
MFTGLIEAVCTVKSVRQSENTMLLSIDLGELADDGRIGDSIAINGVCLTIAKLEGGIASFELSGETLAKSTLGKLKPSSQVNIERAIKASDRFGGHFVQGHIDGKAAIKAIDKRGQFADMKFAAQAELLDQMVVKGSVAVDGISLTIASMDQNSFNVALIPETLNKTTLSRVKIGDEVNIETDIIVKTIKTQLEKILPQKQPLTAEKLKELGF